MEHILQVGDLCSDCLNLGLSNKLRYFHINLEEQILKCESDCCMYPYNDEVSSDSDIGNESELDEKFMNISFSNKTEDKVCSTVNDEVVLSDATSFLDNLLQCDNTSATPLLNFDFSQILLPEQCGSNSSSIISSSNTEQLTQETTEECSNKSEISSNEEMPQVNESKLQVKSESKPYKVNITEDVLLNFNIDSLEFKIAAPEVPKNSIVDETCAKKTTTNVVKRKYNRKPKSIAQQQPSNDTKLSSSVLNNAPALNATTQSKNRSKSGRAITIKYENNLDTQSDDDIPKASIASYFKTIETIKSQIDVIERKPRITNSMRKERRQKSHKAKHLELLNKKEIKSETNTASPATFALSEVLNLIQRKK